MKLSEKFNRYSKLSINVFSILIVSCISLLFIFLLLEAAARIFFPEFKNDYHASNITRGKIIHYSKINNSVSIILQL